MKNHRTEAHKKRHDMLVNIGCAVEGAFHAGRITVHHCFTGMGRRKDHDKTIGLCWEHHLGATGIDGKKMGKRVWESLFGTEEQLLEKVNRRLEHAGQD